MRHTNDPRVLLDVDGVLANFVDAMLDVAFRRYDLRFNHDDITDLDILNIVGKQYENELFAACKAPGYCANIATYPCAVEGVARLRAVADVTILTSPIHGMSWYFERVEWCCKHFGFTPKDVAFMADKTRVDADVLIDDKFETVVNWAACHPDGVGLLWDRPWNRIGSIADMGISDLHEASDMGIDNLARVKSWDDVLKIVVEGARS